MEEIVRKNLRGERALYGKTELKVKDCVFEDGESPLKECKDIQVSGGLFKWKYPLWYGERLTVSDSVWYDGARAGVWYSRDVTVKDCEISAPKNFRRCERLTLENVDFYNAEETLWSCSGVCLKNVRAKGNYLLMNCKDIEVDGLFLDGDYSFDGTENVVIRNSKLLTKDAFWNSKNVTVYDSFISGEYLGWNSENLTLINCTVESLQGMCYVKNLKMINCKLINTTLAFEYSSVEVEINGKIDSVFNPFKGRITADEIGELIVESDKVDEGKTIIKCRAISRKSDRPQWERE